jgi:2-polyprenyl-3-methyl-5-hydroxy-6-metoxy-1,4-benzoquinol methylase
MWVRRQVFERIGLFDTRYFMYFEDADFCRRAEDAGYSVWCVPQARMWHKISLTAQRDKPVNRYHRALNQVRFYRQHAHGPSRMLRDAYILAKLAKTALEDVWHGEWNLIGPLCRGTFDGYRERPGRRENDGAALKHEYVRCNLCGKDETETVFVIRTSETALSGGRVEEAPHSAGGSPHSAGGSPHAVDKAPHSAGESPHAVDEAPHSAGQSPHAVDLVETIVACKSCGLVYVNPRLAPDAGLVTYSADQEKAYFYRTLERRKAAYRELIDRIPRWLGGQARTLLDVGCGDGALIEVARQAGIRSEGSEVSEELIQLVQERLGEGSIVRRPLSELPQAQYDVITLINVLEHVRDPRDMLVTCARLLRPGGILVVHVPNWGGVPARLRGARWRQMEPLVHLYYFTRRTLEALMRVSGLEPAGRFNLVVSRGLRGSMQRLLGSVGLYLDNGLGLVARRPHQGQAK